MVLIFDSFQPITVPFSEITDYQIEWIAAVLFVYNLLSVVKCGAFASGLSVLI